MTFPAFVYDPSLGADEVARALIGCTLTRTYPDGTSATVRIVETEAYDQDDPASHTYHGESPRNTAMFQAGGIAYIYFTYGMHYCLNVVCGPAGYGEGVLIRAVEPLDGLDAIRARRPKARGVNVTNGPAKLTKALEIDKALYARDLSEPPLTLETGTLAPGEGIQATPRIGIAKAVEELRRYVLTEENGTRINAYVSEPRRTREFSV